MNFFLKQDREVRVLVKIYESTGHTQLSLLYCVLFQTKTSLSHSHSEVFLFFNLLKKTFCAIWVPELRKLICGLYFISVCEYELMDVCNNNHNNNNDTIFLIAAGHYLGFINMKSFNLSNMGTCFVLIKLVQKLKH
jgi:hypothetical protein